MADATVLSSNWGTVPTTLGLVAAAAALKPTADAVSGPAGPVSFADLHSRLSATAGVLAAQGLDTDGAVTPGVSAIIKTPEMSPVDAIIAAAGAVAGLRAAAEAIIGTSDFASLPGLFASAVHRFADRVAVVDRDGTSLTYAELDRRSTALARALVERGVGTDVTVAMAVDRTVDLPIAVLGVMKAGGAYIPLDLAHPVERLRYIVENARPGGLLVDRSVGGGLDELALDRWDFNELIAAGEQSTTALPTSVDPAASAYVIYTSGSTGRPKGVQVEHRNVVALMAAAQSHYGFDEHDVWSMFHSHAFDVSVFELWGPLLFGGRLVVVDRDVAREPNQLVALLAAEGVTVFSQTPSAFYQYVEARERVDVASAIRFVVLAGEAVSFEQMRRWYRSFPDEQTVVVNMYGITETTVHTTFRALSADLVESTDASDIGDGLPALTVHVLDERLRHTADGVPGEIYVSGPQVTRGYQNRSDLTSTRFVADPFGAAGDRMYRSGDMAIRRGDTVEYLGRSDGQVQLRGFRVEMGEVEAGMLRVDEVSGAAAMVVTAASGDDLLVGYVVPADGAAIDDAALRQAIGAHVPSYMVPDVIVELDQLPLTVNGKLDRRALPEPSLRTAEFVEPATDTERRVAAEFAAVLGIDRISASASFFDLGGNSLAAARIVGRVGEALDVDLTVRDLFDAPTVRELAAAVADRAPALPPIVRVENRPDRIPLSFAQQRMWLVNRTDPTSAAYNIPALLRVSGALDLDALHAAVIDVAARQSALRTTFPSVGGGPVQNVHGTDRIESLLDWAVVSSADDVAAACATGFDVTTDLPIRVRVLRLEPDVHTLALITHHIASDGESVRPLVADLVTAYRARSAGRAPQFAPLAVDVVDVALWEHGALGSPDDAASVTGRQLAYWTRQLAGLAPIVDLPLDRPRPSVASGLGRRVEFTIDPAVADGIVRVAGELSASPFMVVHAALASLVARLTGADDVAIGTPIAGRGQAVLDPLVGMFVNTLILRTPVPRDATFDDVIEAAKTADLDAFANADVPFEYVVDATGAERSAAFAPLSQVWFTLDESAARDALDGVIDGLSIVPEDVESAQAKVDLFVRVERAADPAWRGEVIYAADLFEHATVVTFADRLVRLLTAGVADRHARLDSVVVDAPPTRPAVDAPAEPDAPLSAEIVTGGPATAPELLSEIFARAAAAHGPRLAVADESSRLTYAELDRASNRLARRLLALGAGPEMLVALAVGRSTTLLVAIWATAKTGAGYVPIDPDYPADRVTAMIEDSGARIGLTVSGGRDLPTSGVDWTVVDADALIADLSGTDTEPIRADELNGVARTDNVAYVIYTSGSTGRPKGVSVTHVGLKNFAVEEARRSGADEYSRVLGFASPSFDASVLEYLLATISGGTLVYRPAAAVGGAALTQLMLTSAITHTFLTPTVLSTLDPMSLPALRVVYAGGEAVPRSLKDAWAQHLRIQNLYGPTETTIGVAISAPMAPGAPVALGGPIAGVGFLVLDAALRPTPDGVAGELYVVGGALSRGYLDRPGLTAERFVADPFTPGGRMYRTGDLVRWRVDASGDRVLDYSGRTDDQVKLRGLRIELGEIEAALADHDAVASAVVVGVGGSVATALAGYVVPVPGAAVDAAELRAHLGARLPAHMVPASVTLLDGLPLTPVGKLDKAALPEPVVEVVEHVAPATEAETAVAAAFADVLGGEPVSVTASFFDLGGDSLSAMRLAGRIESALGVSASIQDVFDAPTVRGLAERVLRNDAALPPVTRAEPRPDRIPLSYAQQRMWFINRFDPSAPTYNVPVVIAIAGALDVDALAAAFGDVVARHESLRTRFPDDDGVPYQDVSAVDEPDWAVAGSRADIDADLRRGFDVRTDRPIRARLARTGEDDHVLAVVAHHIVADGESLGPLVADLLAAYAARSAGESPRFEPLPVQFADVAVWERAVLGELTDPESLVAAQLDHWRGVLAGSPAVIDLPADRPRPAVASGRGGLVEFDVPDRVARAVEEIAAARGSTVFMVLHAALAVLLARLSATTDIAISTPSAGRADPSLDGLVGMRVNTLVLRTEIDLGKSFVDLLDAVRRTDLEALGHADVPFEAVVDAVAPVRSEAFAPLAQVMLSFDPVGSIDRDGVDAAGVTFTELAPAVVPAHRDLTVVVSAGQTWTASAVYAADLFDEATAHTLAASFVDLLDGLVAAPDSAVGDVPLLSDSDVDGLLAWSTGPTAGDVDPLTCATAATRVGDDAALVFGDREVSRTEFAARVNVLARTLIGHGVGPGSAVAVCMERSVELLVGVHAITAAGGQYVPLDPQAPVGRSGHMLATAGVDLALVRAGAPVPSAVAEVTVIGVDSAAPIVGDAGPVDDAERTAPIRPTDALYTLFTSGSTGRPKGVTVSHEAVANRLAWMNAWYPISADDRVLHKTPVTFDVSVWELYWPLLHGVPLVIAEPGRHGDPSYLAGLIADRRISVLHFVPSMLAAFVDVLGDRVASLGSLRHVFASGEALTPAVAGALLDRLPGVGLHNLYGPTEAAVDVTARTVAPGDTAVTIGRPVPGVTTLVLDARLRPTPVGVPGELYLGGVQVARGYAARPDLTAERFVADPYGPAGGRLYRTGDAVRWTADGELDYLGRTDFQVKLRGQRIELGEIESVIGGAPGVVHAAAVVVDTPGGQQLVGYYAPDTVETDTVSAAVASALPEYMRPAVWVPLESVPLTTSGKVDRRALPAPTVGDREYVAPAAGRESAVADVFAVLLGVPVGEVSATTSFFELGGNSLSGMRLVSRVGEALGVDVTIRDVFDAPTVRDLVALLDGRAAALPAVVRTDPRPPVVPVSRAQQRMWFLNQFDPASGAYNIPLVLRLDGAVDAVVLSEALGDVVERHEVLRTVYPTVDGRPVQRVLDSDTARRDLDWATVSDIDALLASTADGFDVSVVAPVRGRVLVGDTGVAVAITVHHIAFDGESVPVLARDLLAAYAARAHGSTGAAPLDVQYADYALWQSTHLGSTDDADTPLGRQSAYWAAHLVDLPQVTDLPMDRPRPSTQQTAGGRVVAELDDSIADGVAALAARYSMTPFMVTEAAFAVTLARLASTRVAAIGTVVAGRSDAALDDLVGMFVNTLVLRTDVAPSARVSDILADTRTTVLDAFANADVALDDLVDSLGAERSAAYPPLAQVTFTYGDKADPTAVVEAAGIRAQALAPTDVEAKFELMAAVQERTATAPMSLELVYATALFDESTVVGFADVYRRVLAAMIADQDVAVGDIVIADTRRASRPAIETVAVGGDVEGGTLVDVLARRDLDPTHPALICDGVEIDYDEFEARTNTIARALLERGVTPDDVIAIGLERSIDSVLAVWGVVKAGAAYVPVDPAYPQDRIDYMLADSAVEIGITDAATRHRLGRSGTDWLELAQLGSDRDDDIEDAERNGSVRVANLAYLIYTSGSTGRPKAVGVSHSGVADLVDSHAKVTGSRDDDPDTRILHVASPSFDASFFEMAWAILAGHTLVIAPHADYAGDALAEVIDRDEVTDLVITPSVLATVDPERADSVRNLATAGEACPPELVERWTRRGRRIFNFYGPSETTVWATRSRMMAGKPVTIGKAITGFTTRVLDARLHETPVGVVGELYLSAAGLARGDLGRSGLTATSFVADPFGAPGDRMYATGDLVRLTRSGDIEFAGRADHQVKINGQRVELGEIEAVLADRGGVAQALVIGRDSRVGDRTHTQLVAYLVAKPGARVDADAVLDDAATRLAAHMVPTTAIVIDEIPLTPTGKLDREALPEPDTAERAEHVAPGSDAEQTLARIVGGLLGLDAVSVTESFFALGGDSIMSIQLSSAAKAAGLRLTPREIFELKTIRAMAAQTAGGSRVAELPEPDGGPRGDTPLPAGVGWMLENSVTDADHADFSQSAVLHAPAGLTVEQLRDLVDALVAAHPMMSATLRRSADGHAVLESGAPFDPVGAVSARTTDTAVGTAGFAHAVTEAFAAVSRDLDPAAGRLVRAVLLTDPSGAGRIVVVIHHLGIDAVSWRIVVEDLITARAQQVDGRDIDLRPEGTSARAWSTALAADREARSAEVDFWLARSPERVTDFGVSLDRDRDRAATVVSRTRTVPASVAESLLAGAADAFRTGVDALLLAALGRAVSEWQRARGIDDDAPVTVLLEGHGRVEDAFESGPDPRRADLARTVGWFTSIAPVLLPRAADPVHAVKAVKEELLARPGDGLGYGVLRYASTTDVAARPLPAITFNYLGNTSAETTVGDFLPDAAAPALPASLAGAMTTSALTVTVTTRTGDDGRELVLDLASPSAVLGVADVDDLTDRWVDALAAIAADVAAGDPGLSPSDVTGVDLTQDDLDALAREYPGAAVWPLSPLQSGLAFQAELAEAGRADGAVDVYVTQSVIRLAGDVDVDRLRSATGDLLARHDVLRSGYVRTPSGIAAAVVPPDVDVPWTVVEAAGDIGDSVDAVARAERTAPFDMARPPLMRFALVRSSGRADLIVTNHHILLDGWSGPLVLADLLALYATGRTFTDGTGAAGDFHDYLRYIAGADTAAGLAAWTPVLDRVTTPTLVAPGAQVTTDDPPRKRTVPIDADLTAAVTAAARSRGVTVSTVLQVAWGLLLSRITGQRTVAFGETVSGRPADLPGVESMVGLFINTVPVVVDLDPAATAADVLADLQAAKVAVLDHHHIGLPELSAVVGAGQLFDTLAVHESFPVDTGSLRDRDLGGLTVEGVDTLDATHYPLIMVTGENGDRLDMTLTYLPSAFDERRIDVVAQALHRILETIAADPGTVIADIESADHRGYAAALTAPVVDTVNTGRTLVDLYAETTARYGADGAVSDGVDTLTHAELSERAAAIATSLTAAGVVPGDLVAIATSRSVALPAAILGVLSAGAAYLPLDTTNPADRLAFIVSDAEPSALLVDTETAGSDLWLSLPPQVVVIDVDDLTPGRAPAPVPAIHPDSRAYVIYTSGSTGRPKGVEVTHRDVVTLMDTAATDFAFESTDVWTMFHSYAFDFSVWELWGPLLTGGRLVIVGRDVARSPAEFVRLCADEQVTVLSLTPSAFYQFAHARRDAGQDASALRYLVFGGEELNFEHVRRWFDDFPNDPATLVNMYGITETTVHVTFAPLDRAVVRADDPSLIGPPLASLGLHILDERLRPVPEGFIGEMYVTGGQLAQSYLRRPGLSAGRFVANPFGPPGSRMYRTGDLARRVGDDIAYLGRGDAQVQLRGYRIEYGEIEAAMLASPGVRSAAATVSSTGAGDDRLVGYVVLDGDAELDAPAVRAAVGRAVPAYMVPDLVVAIDELPLTANGKLDRRALPAPDPGEAPDEFTAPADAREEAVAAVFAEVLGADGVGVTTSFFDLGGNSLSASRLAARTADVLGRAVSVRDVFSAPTVRDLVAATAGNASSTPQLTAAAPRPDRLPLSFAQQRIWFIEQLEPGTATYNIPIAVRLIGRLDVVAMRAAVGDVVARHEILRTTFGSVDGEPVQTIHPEVAPDWLVVDDPADLTAAAGAGFDVAAAPPFRVRLHPVSGDEHVLVAVLHHLVGDGESMRPLIGDIVTAYLARAAGVAPSFAPLDVQFADFAVWQRAALGSPDDPASILGAQLDFWESALAGAPDVIDLPTDRPRPAVASHRGASVSVPLSGDTAGRVRALAAARGTSEFMVVHAALAALLSRLTATDDVTVATPVAGRGAAALDPLVGMFVNTLVLRTSVPPRIRFADLLDDVRVADLDAFAHADVPFEAVVDRVAPVRSQAFGPLAQVILTLVESRDAPAEAVAGLTVEPVDPPVVPAQYDLSVTVTTAADGWSVGLVYATDLFDEATARGFGLRLVALLDGLTSSPDEPISSPAIVTADERAAIAEWSSGPPQSVPSTTLLHLLTAERA
ncbi:non-ribosomal peptide synthetase [Gordonia spumicola]|uniref:non-ribosomal peptide synthetase n=1 Tax=Gordonia spumicola TaxID=589161 RepID=UPI00137A6848|nr:non-ribosomal peptide synthetase [Gordonia spumicola]